MPIDLLKYKKIRKKGSKYESLIFSNVLYVSLQEAKSESIYEKSMNNGIAIRDKKNNDLIK